MLMLPTQDHAVRITELANHMNPTSLVRDWSRQDKMTQLQSGVEQGQEGQGRPSEKVFFSPHEKKS